MAKNIEKLYSDLFKLRSDLEDLIEKAQTIVASSREFPGMINKVLNEQMTKYFIPSVQKLSNDLRTPGSVAGVVKFLDAVPLAFTREKEPVSPVDPTVPENLNLETPTGTEALTASDLKPSNVSELPQNISYAKPQGEAAPAQDIREAKIRKPELRGAYRVIRASKINSSLGDSIAKIRDNVIFEFTNEDEARAKAEDLNKGVTPEERELLGTEYQVKAV